MTWQFVNYDSFVVQATVITIVNYGRNTFIVQATLNFKVVVRRFFEF